MKDIQIIVSHPTGNQNCRSVLAMLEQKQALAWFGTMLGFTNSKLLNVFPGRLRCQLFRRYYALSPKKIRIGGIREMVRLTAAAIGWKYLIRHEVGWASIDHVYRTLDQFVANKLGEPHVRAVYAYEDGALQTFRKAKERGIRCIYELPIAYWETVRRLLKEEAERLPEWSSTLSEKQDSVAKFERKAEELALADLVICPSHFVMESLPVLGKRMAVIPFGSPPIANLTKRIAGKIRVLFVGTLTQRKGLADLFRAIQLLGRKDIELVVLGTPLAPQEFYQTQCPNFIYEAPRAHHQILEFMSTCDIFVLPSLVEGRALVIQEAMSRGLPVIITAHTGAADVIEESDCGFLVPIRSPESIAEKINLLADSPDLRRAMGEQARMKAAKMTWELHGERTWREIESLL